MSNKSAREKLIIFFILFCVGYILASIISILPFLASGLEFQDIANNPSLVYEGSALSLRLSLFLNHLFTFLLPSIIYGIYFFRRDFFKGFDSDTPPIVVHIILGIFFLIAAYPLVNFLHYINMQIPMMDWMRANEQNVSEMLNKIIISDSKLVLAVNILLISLMPALGEELVFRGIIQKNLGKIVNNGHIAVWIAAFLFSAIHMQFEGFLARIALGAVMGYAYYYTRNFWIPVLLHFLNNLIPLLGLAVMDIDLTNTMEGAESFTWISLVIPAIGLPLIYFLLNKFNGERNIS